MGLYEDFKTGVDRFIKESKLGESFHDHFRELVEKITAAAIVQTKVALDANGEELVKAASVDSQTPELDKLLVKAAQGAPELKLAQGIVAGKPSLQTKPTVKYPLVPPSEGEYQLPKRSPLDSLYSLYLRSRPLPEAVADNIDPPEWYTDQPLPRTAFERFFGLRRELPLSENDAYDSYDDRANLERLMRRIRVGKNPMRSSAE